MLLCASSAQAWHVSGKVLCDSNANGLIDDGDTPVPNVQVHVANRGQTFAAVASTDATGFFFLSLPHDVDSYVASLGPTSLPLGATVVLPAGGIHFFSLRDEPVEAQSFENANFLLNCGGADVPPPPANGFGVRTPGYWKNHPEAWPAEVVVIGGVSYTKSVALALMKNGDDKSLALFFHLVATKLNLLAGADASCIQATVDAADAWLASFAPGSKVKANSAAWTTAEPWKNELDAYNNGGMCAPKAN